MPSTPQLDAPVGTFPSLPGSRTLDLTLLAAGTRQHAFVPTHGSREWVYKIPATSGLLQQYGPDLAEYNPVGRLKSLFFNLCVRWPDDVYRRLVERQARSASRARSIFAAFAERSYAAFSTARHRWLERAYRWTRLRYFRRMLSITQHVVRQGLSDLLVMHHVLENSEATLRTPTGVRRYRGPILVQEWAVFFDRSGCFDAFDWNDVIDAQHRMWRRGVALSDANEILGPKNWALVGGQLRLGDFSSFTTNYRQARRGLRPDILDARQQRVLRRLRNEVPAQAVLAEQYFKRVRAEINEARLAQLWRRDLR
jgi:hypothetical protein